MPGSEFCDIIIMQQSSLSDRACAMYSWPTHSLARASYAMYAHHIIMSLLTVEKLKIFMFDQGQFRSLFVCLENCYGVARINLLNIILLLPDSPPVFKGLYVGKAA